MSEEDQLNQRTPASDAGEGLVFYVGPPRSGSKTAAWALDLLGYPALHEWAGNMEALKSGDWNYFLGDRYRMFADGLGWGYARLHDRFPRARYFCFLRSPDEIAWSLYRLFRHMTAHQQPVDPEWRNVGKKTTVIRDGYNALLEHFADANCDQFHCQTIGEGWPPLCRWLGVPIPEVAFPHSNKSWCLGDKENIMPPQGMLEEDDL